MTPKATVISLVAVIAVAAAAAVLVLRLHTWRPGLATIQGAVIRSDKDAQKEVPIAGVLVTASRGQIAAGARTDASGYFKIVFPDVIWPGQTVYLTFRDSDYHPVDLPLTMTFRSTLRRLIVAAMEPAGPEAEIPLSKELVVSNLRIRYTVNTENEENVGSAVRTFQVVNQGDIPCRREGPCSPDGSWKASSASLTMDAGPGNEFRNVRASCIAGPCPFTRIDAHGFEQGGRTIVASAIAWSGTATFLLEAEVFRTGIGSSVRRSYPVIFDRSLTFTLPASQEGVSIEAEINGTPMVFPLGPDIYLDWATCTYRTTRGTNSIVYQCDLKPGYRF